ncbi:MAG: hypothetical protein CSYNP_02890 [Syntrophus sp. SKADARSKE-3]|nr:hypothetical protein [Syntrophus sp. SKADARSKE-3]
MVFLLLTFFFPAANWAAKDTEWQLLRDMPGYTTYIDTASIAEVTGMPTHFRVRYKIVAKTKDYREFIQDLRLEEGRSIEGYDKYAHTLSAVELDCAGSRHRTLNTVDYDKTGKVLGKTTEPEAWKKTFPETTFAALALWICEDAQLMDDSPDDEKTNEE